MVKLVRQSGGYGVKIIVAVLAVAIIAVAGYVLIPSVQAADDCSGCGPHKSKFE